MLHLTVVYYVIIKFYSLKLLGIIVVVVVV